MEDKKVMNTPKEGTQSTETKTNEKKVEQVTSSAAKIKKESWVQKRAKAFVSDDAKNVGDYIVDAGTGKEGTVTEIHIFY